MKIIVKGMINVLYVMVHLVNLEKNSSSNFVDKNKILTSKIYNNICTTFNYSSFYDFVYCSTIYAFKECCIGRYV